MACIVVISWISFWLGPDAAPARISLGILTVLTITTRAQEGNMVTISYVRAADVWVAGCEAFVFAALLEYAIVSVYQRHTLKENDEKKENNHNVSV